jgi:hypothetical protein
MSCPQEMAPPGADSGANVRTALLMYVGTRAGVFDRARKATK